MKKHLFLFLIFCNLSSIIWADENILLNSEELDWIEKHPVIRLAPDPFFAPLEFLENGVYKGIANDYLNLIAGRTGLNIVVVRVDSWEETLELLKTRKADINGASTPTAPREEYLIFTEPIFESNILIFGTPENSSKVNIKDLMDKRVGVIAGYAEEDYLNIVHPELDLIRFETIEEALRELSLGQFDYFFGDLAFVGYQKKNLGLTNIIVAGEIDYKHHLSIAVRSDWPILRDILQKGLETITVEEKREISDRWIGLNIENAYISKSILSYFLYAAGLILLVLIIILLWNRTLARRIDEKTKILNQQLEEKKLQTERLLRSNQDKITLLHEVQHRVNNNMQIIMSLLNLDLMENNSCGVSDRTLSRINLVADVQERSQTNIKVGKIEVYGLLMDIIYNLEKITGKDIRTKVRIKETNLLCDINTAVSLGILLNEIIFNMNENILICDSSCYFEFLKEAENVLSVKLGMDEHDLSKTDIEGQKNSPSNLIINSMLDTLVAKSEITSINTLKGRTSQWNLLIPEAGVI